MVQKPLRRILTFGALLALVLLIVMGPPISSDAGRRVVIDDSDIIQLRASWIRQWQREPTPQELRSLLEQFIREEVLYREAVARNFDKDDLVVRRAMQRKMEFLGESQVEEREPTDEEIEAYFALRRERYRVPARISFVQVYFSRDQRGDQAVEDAKKALEAIQRDNPDLDALSEFGDRLMLQADHRDQTEQQVSSQFGAEFAGEIMTLQPGSWNGPVESGYGLHLVKVRERTESYVPEWTTIKRIILEDMTQEARNAAKELFYTEILRNYEVVYQGQTLDILRETNGQ